MRILVCCPHGYYSNRTGDSYEFISFIHVPRQMGHRVHHLDHAQLATWDRDQFNDLFLTLAEKGGYHLILVMTYRDEFHREVLDQAKRYTVTLAWNCDDDWRWENYSSQWAKHFTHMVTTVRKVYEAHNASYPNLLLSQWGCTGLNEGIAFPKDIAISFVGATYGDRGQQIRFLQRKIGLHAFGKGVPQPPSWRQTPRQLLAKLAHIPWDNSQGEVQDQASVKSIWNRSRLSFTPLCSSVDNRKQVKARVFDMGLSGTMMLCDKIDALHEYYTPSKEYVEYESVEEVVDLARYYFKREAERHRIAERYYERTSREHLWVHRFKKLFMDVGLH